MTAVSARCYVFGIVPADAPVPSAGGDGPAAELRTVAAGDTAALVGSLNGQRSLGRAADLLAHDRVLNEVVASGTPVLPMRFGAVLSDEAAVLDELLGPHLDEFRAALHRVAGHVQYTLHVQFEQDVVLPEVLAAHPEIAALRGSGELRQRLRLGELVVRALEELRPTEAAALLSELAGATDVRQHEPESADDVLRAAFLVRSASADAFEASVENAARRRHERLRVRLIGPTAAYDFVGDG